MASRAPSSTASRSDLRLDPDHHLRDDTEVTDLDAPDVPPVVASDPEPDPTPPEWMTAMASRAMSDVAFLFSRLPGIRSNLAAFMIEREPLLDVPARDVAAAIRSAASTALGFPMAGQAEADALAAWADAVAVRVIEGRRVGHEVAGDARRASEAAEAERLYRIQNAEKIAEAERWAAYASQRADFEAWQAGQPQPVA
jgi:hypothetical protein